MSTIELIGIVSENGELTAKVPNTVKPGEVRIVVELPDESTVEEDLTWTDKELESLLTVEPLTGPEIITFLNSPEYLNELAASQWKNIADGAEWVEQQRRQRRERNKW
jgi:hypothetical protein